MYKKTTNAVCKHQEQRMPISYFMSNKNQVIDNLKLKILDLKGMLYTCSDSQVSTVQREIQNLERAIKYNKILK